MNTKYYDNLFVHEEDDAVVYKSWVFENDAWTYRILTPEEIKQILELEEKNR